MKNMMIAARNITKEQVETIIAQVICAETCKITSGDMETCTVHYYYKALNVEVMAVTKNYRTKLYTVRLSKDFYSKTK